MKLEVAGTAIVDTELTGSVTVTGCEGPADVILKDGARELLKFKTTADAVATPFALTHEHTRGRGFTVELVLKAATTCGDGRAAVSREIGASFFPVAKAFSLPGDEQVVTDTFVIEGEGNGATFLGCAANPNGTTALARVSAAGEIIVQRELPFRCSNQLRFTARSPLSGVRWVYEPGVAEVAIAPSLEVLSSRKHNATQLEILPGGDALSFSPTASPNLARFPASAADPVWVANTARVPVGPMRVLDASQARLIVYDSPGEFSYDVLMIEEYDLARGTLIDAIEIYRFPRGAAVPLPILSEDATTLFVAEPTGMGITNVYACATNLAGCSGAALKWQAVPVPGEAQKIETYAGDARLLVVTSAGTFTFDARSGDATNFGALPIDPVGNLATLSVVPTDTSAFFLLNGPAPTQQNPYPGALELLAVDDAGRGEVFRLQIASHSLAADVDEAGALWIRVGPRLVQAHPLGLYRTARTP